MWSGMGRWESGVWVGAGLCGAMGLFGAMWRSAEWPERLGLASFAALVLCQRWERGAWLGEANKQYPGCLFLFLFLAAYALLGLSGRVAMKEALAFRRCADRRSRWALARSPEAARDLYASRESPWEDVTPQWAVLLVEAAGSGLEGEREATLAFLHSLFAEDKWAGPDPAACHRLLHHCLLLRPAVAAELWARPGFVEDLVRDAWELAKARRLSDSFDWDDGVEPSRVLWELLKDASPGQLSRFLGLERGGRLLVVQLALHGPGGVWDLDTLLACLHRLLRPTLPRPTLQAHKRVLLGLGLDYCLASLCDSLDGRPDSGRIRRSVESLKALVERGERRATYASPPERPAPAVPAVSWEGRLCRALFHLQTWATILAGWAWLYSSARFLLSSPLHRPKTKPEPQKPPTFEEIFTLLLVYLCLIVGLAAASMVLVLVDRALGRCPSWVLRREWVLAVLGWQVAGGQLTADAEAGEAPEVLAFLAAYAAKATDQCALRLLHHCFLRSQRLRGALWAQSEARRSVLGLLKRTAAEEAGWREVEELSWALLRDAPAEGRARFAAEGGGASLVARFSVSGLAANHRLHTLLQSLGKLLLDGELAEEQRAVHARLLEDLGLGVRLEHFLCLTEGTARDQAFGAAAKALRDALRPPARLASRLTTTQGQGSLFSFPH